MSFSKGLYNAYMRRNRGRQLNVYDFNSMSDVELRELYYSLKAENSMHSKLFLKLSDFLQKKNKTDILR